MPRLSPPVVLVCRHCRVPLGAFPPLNRLTSHGVPLEGYWAESGDSVYCQELRSQIGVEPYDHSIYIEATDENGQMTYWIRDQLNEHSWSRGGLKCPSCSSNIGSFDFVSGRRCACGKALLPALRFTRSKVDEKYKRLRSCLQEDSDSDVVTRQRSTSS